MRQTAIKAVLLDLDDTLVQTQHVDSVAMHSGAQIAASGSGSSIETIERNFRALLAAEAFPPDGSPLSTPQWRAGLWQRAIADEHAPSDLGCLAYEEWNSVRLREFKFAPEVCAMLRRLQEAQLRLAIITNGNAEVQRPKLLACDASSIFGDNIVVSGEQPEPKPHRSIFDTACAMLGVKPSEAVMVGDSLSNDIQGGINADLAATLWVRGKGVASIDPGVGPQPTYTLNSILELEGILLRGHAQDECISDQLQKPAETQVQAAEDHDDSVRDKFQ